MYPTNPYNQYPFNSINNSPMTVQTNKIYVNTYDEVVKYPMPANCDMIFINKTEPVLYDKITDAYGSCTIKTFIIKEKVEEATTVNKTDLQTILDRLDALESAKNTPKIEEA